VLFALPQGCHRPPEIARPTKTVLFIGNSLTSVNDLPNTFAQLSASGGHSVQVDSHTPGGWSLAQQDASEGAYAKLLGCNWDFVVLQEQSILPALDNHRLQDMYPAVRTLNAVIREKGSTPLLYLTFGRRDGYPEGAIKDFASVQERLNQGYMDIAQELSIGVVPVGPAWKTAHERKPELGLWSGDGIHPAPAGTYLAACVFYCTIYGESPEGLAYRADSSVGDARFLQQVAAETVLHDLQRWAPKSGPKP